MVALLSEGQSIIIQMDGIIGTETFKVANRRQACLFQCSQYSLDASVFKRIFISQQQLAIWNVGRRQKQIEKKKKVFYDFKFFWSRVDANGKMISFDLSLVHKTEKLTDQLSCE